MLDSFEQRLKLPVALALVGIHRPRLAQCLPPRLKAHILHRRQVFHPQAINDAQHDQSLEHPHVFRPQLLFPLLIKRLRQLGELAFNLLRLHFQQRVSRQRGGQWKDRGHIGEQTFHIPAYAVFISHVAAHHIPYLIPHHRQNVGLEVGAVQDFPAFRINKLAVLVDDVVILDQVFAHVKVEALHPDLGTLNGAVHQLVLNGHAFVHSHPVHNAFNALTAEAPHHVILKGNEKARTARVSLPSRATPQLVIDPPCLVALRADNVQSTI